MSPGRFAPFASPCQSPSRRLHGLATATFEDAWNLRKYPDSIARSSWDIDVWPADSHTRATVHRNEPRYKERAEKAAAGDFFDIRYGCIVARGVDNLLMAGRCISAGHQAQSSLRIQQTSQATGQAAGTAAALSLKENVTPRELDPMKVVAHRTFLTYRAKSRRTYGGMRSTTPWSVTASRRE